MCAGRPPLQAGEIDDAVDDNFLKRVEFLYYEQCAGRGDLFTKLNSEEWTGLVAFVAAEKQRERGARINLESLIESIKRNQK